MASTIFVNRLRRLSGLLLIAFALAACTSKQVVVQGNYPTPLMEPIPLTLGVAYPPEFANHEFFDEAKGRSESDWLVRTGEAQVNFWNTMLGGMFTRVVPITSSEALDEIESELDAVLVPTLDDLQYTIPLHTNVKVYEIWMRYRFRLIDPVLIRNQENGTLSFYPEESIADWTLTAYGKTPTAFLQTDEAAVNTAAIVALRDAGANFATTFNRVPDVSSWRNTMSMQEGAQ